MTARDLDLAFEELARVGCTVLADACAADVIATMAHALDRAIGDAGTAHALLETAPVFLDILRIDALNLIVEALLSPAALVLRQDGIVMQGGGRAQGRPGWHQDWHRDLSYPSWVTTRPLAISALLALDDFTEASGATLFLPGSHRDPARPSDAFAARWARPVLASAGSVIVFDAMVFHRDGVNRGMAPCRAVNTVFGVPLLARQAAFTARPDMDALPRRRLGIDYQPAASTDAWRARRAARRAEPPR